MRGCSHPRTKSPLPARLYQPITIAVMFFFLLHFRLIKVILQNHTVYVLIYCMNNSILGLHCQTILKGRTVQYNAQSSLCSYSEHYK